MFYSVNVSKRVVLGNTCSSIVPLSFSIVRIKLLWVYCVCVSKIASMPPSDLDVHTRVCMHASALTSALSVEAGIPRVPHQNKTTLIVSSDVGNGGWWRWRKEKTREPKKRRRVKNRGKVLVCALAASCGSIGDFKSEREG